MAPVSCHDYGFLIEGDLRATVRIFFIVRCMFSLSNVLHLVSQHLEKCGGCFAFHRGAKKNYEVRLRAVITYYDPEEPDLFVQDSTSGIWVNLEIVKPNVPFNTGDLVE